MSKYKFDITVTDNTYAGDLSLPYVTAAVKSGRSIATGAVDVLEGITDKAVISNLGINDPVVAAACGFSSGNDTSLTEQVLQLTDLKVNEEICRGTIMPTWIAAQGRMERNGELPIEFSDFLLQSVAAKAGESVENGIWLGTSPYGIGFLSDNGTVNEAGADASACAGFVEHTFIDALDATDIIADMSGVIQTAVANVSGILDKPGCGFYVSNETYWFYAQALATAGSNQGINNLGANQDLRENLSFQGFPVYRCPGMANDVILFTYPENLAVGTNLQTDMTEAQLIPTYQYDGSDNVRVVMRMQLGVQTRVPGDGVYGATFWT